VLLWFPRPLEIASEQTQAMFNDIGRGQIPRLQAVAREAQERSAAQPGAFLLQAAELGADAAWLLDNEGKVIRGGVACANQPSGPRSGPVCTIDGVQGKLLRVLPSGVEVWQAQSNTYFGARVPAVVDGRAVGSVVAAYRTNAGFLP